MGHFAGAADLGTYISLFEMDTSDTTIILRI